MGRSQRHLREQHGIDSKFRAAKDERPAEPSRKTDAEQDAKKTARGVPLNTPSTN